MMHCCILLHIAFSSIEIYVPGATRRLSRLASLSEARCWATTLEVLGDNLGHHSALLFINVLCLPCSRCGGGVGREGWGQGGDGGGRGRKSKGRKIKILYNILDKMAVREH